VHGKILTLNDSWGQDFILDNPLLRRDSMGLALTFTEIEMVTKNKLDEVSYSQGGAKGEDSGSGEVKWGFWVGHGEPASRLALLTKWARSQPTRSRLALSHATLVTFLVRDSRA